MASVIENPVDNPVTRPALNASPAPVVSRAETLRAGWVSIPSGITRRTPRSPRVTTTSPTPLAWSERAAASISRSPVAATPLNAASSVWFGVRMSTSARTGSDSDTAGAGLRIVVAPAARARSAAPANSSGEHSN
jgi:hypothetical protein